MKQSLLLNYQKPRLDYQLGKEWSLGTWRKKILLRDRFSCKNCKNEIYDFYRRRGKRLEAHHIIPRMHGGKNTTNNGVTLCNFCHNYVGYVYARYGVDFKQLARNKKRGDRIMEAKKILKYSYLRFLRNIIRYN
jgi:hypothetical protein